MLGRKQLSSCGARGVVLKSSRGEECVLVVACIEVDS